MGDPMALDTKCYHTLHLIEGIEIGSGIDSKPWRLV